MHPASAPTSPLLVRKRRDPLTPQRATHQSPTSSLSSSLYTPPLSLGHGSSTNSTFTSPDTSVCYSSPLVLREKRRVVSTGGDWRSRAKENGIRVASDQGSPSPAFMSNQGLFQFTTPSPKRFHDHQVRGSFSAPTYLPRRYADTVHASPALSDIDEYNTSTYSSPYFESIVSQPDFQPTEPSCSVCNATNPAATLSPCGHHICNSCITSALNIAGEKDMMCAFCKTPVGDMQLIPRSHNTLFASNLASSNQFKKLNLFDDILVNPQSVVPRTVREEGNPVIRVDNVPWDATPGMLSAWLKVPCLRAHVLLDGVGKTLSHAFIEMHSAEDARAALRSASNSILGYGKRARAVTVTLSSQEELMRALFPNWLGNFHHGVPSIAGLEHAHALRTLERGLLTVAELESLLHLVRSPDSHFLKVASLPFYKLVAILHKFPAAGESRMFWSDALRDKLFNVTMEAYRVLVSNVRPPANDFDVLGQVAVAALTCQAFSPLQIAQVDQAVHNALHTMAVPNQGPAPQQQQASASFPPLPQSCAPSPDSSEPVTPATPEHGGIATEPHVSPVQSTAYASAPAVHANTGTPFDTLAAEFGVETSVIEALAQRLSGSLSF